MADWTTPNISLLIIKVVPIKDNKHHQPSTKVYFICLFKLWLMLNFVQKQGILRSFTNHHDFFTGGASPGGYNQYQGGAKNFERGPNADIPILKLDNQNEGDGNYLYAFETGNGIQAQQQGVAQEGAGTQSQVSTIKPLTELWSLMVVIAGFLLLHLSRR